jgi:uncharacterized hydrophobic protein (TIGR00271 family)
MVIAMLLGPISGIGVALVDSDNRLLWKASTALVGGVFIVLGVALAIGFFNSEIPATREMTQRTAPNIFDLMIALGGGAAGAYATISPRLSVAFVGVAIATALVPPLAVCGLFLARGDLALSAGALLLALTNIVAIQVACSAVFFLCGFRRITGSTEPRWESFLEKGVSITALLVLGAVLTANLHAMVSKLLYESAVRRTLRTDLTRYPGAFLADVRTIPDGNSTLVKALIRGPEPLSAEQVAEMERKLPPPPGQHPSKLWVRYVHTTVMSAQGPVYSSEGMASRQSILDR